jgi:O-antigen/teichoic acid export membrane protein
MDSGEPKDGDNPDHALSALEAFEAAAEGVAGIVALTPGGPMPSLGGEMLLPDGGGDGVEVGADTVRSGIMQAGPLAIAGVAVNAVNVLVTILVARLLTTRDYGLLNQLTGIFLIISMPGSAVIVGIVRRVTMWLTDGEGHRIRDWARRVHTQGTLIAVAFFITMVVTGEWVASLLNQPNAVGVVAIVGAGAVWILLSLDRGLLQAHRDYRTLAINLIVEGAARTAGIVVFVVIGAGASGIAVGIMLAEIVTAVHARISADRAWDHEARIDRPEGLVRHVLKLIGHPVSTVRSWLRHLESDPAMVAPRELKITLVSDLVVALAALAMLAILQNIDVIILGRDNPKMSGSYAAVSVASKAIVYGAVVLGSYLLPEAAIRWREGGHALRQTAVAVLLLSIPASALLVLSQFFPRLLLELVFGPRYLGAQAAFAPLVGAMICLSLSVILTMYLLAVGWRWVSGILVIGAGAIVGAVIAAHGDPVSTARNDFIVQGILLAALTIAFVAIHQMRKAPAVD